MGGVGAHSGLPPCDLRDGQLARCDATPGKPSSGRRPGGATTRGRDEGSTSGRSRLPSDCELRGPLRSWIRRSPAPGGFTRRPASGGADQLEGAPHRGVPTVPGRPARRASPPRGPAPGRGRRSGRRCGRSGGGGRSGSSYAGRPRAAIAAETRASVARSRLAVASSRSSTAGSTSSARASAMSWRWPEESEPPRSEISWQVAAGQGGDEVVGADRPGGGLDLGVGGLGPAVGDVVADRAGEQEGLLGHVAEPAAEVVQAEGRAGRARRA